ncbi:MAG TPA: Tm-1-like ATP-binding domain-containing protein, partial [Aggregatilineales bacterium]|nr:Tm-1-like ATP-binding domain-containing protein [Aggregatilineales bacterium]
TKAEQLDAARFTVEKLNKATGEVSVVVPLRCGSVMENVNGGNFWDADISSRVNAIFREGLRKDIHYQEVDGHINDNAFAEVVLQEVLRLLA